MNFDELSSIPGTTPEELNQINEGIAAMAASTEEPRQSAPVQLPNRRVLPNSKRGDRVWHIVQPVLQWLIDNGDEAAHAQALQTRAYWEQQQHWLIKLLNDNHYFELVERAIADRRGYERALLTLPPCTGMQMDYYTDEREQPCRVDVVAYLALVAAKRQHKKQGFRRGKGK